MFSLVLGMLNCSFGCICSVYIDIFRDDDDILALWNTSVSVTKKLEKHFSKRYFEEIKTKFSAF